MEYLINLWKRSHSNGTVCVWRGSDRREFERMKSEIIKQYKPYRNIARLSVFEKHVVYSFADSADGFGGFVRMVYFKQPLFVRYVKTGKENNNEIRRILSGNR